MVNLREKYNLSENASLIIFKVDVYDEQLIIPQVEYEVYSPDTNQLLDMNYCKDEKIYIIVPYPLDENNSFKYNSSNVYYNDVCYTYKTNEGTDMTLYDRKMEYNEKYSQPLCQTNCSFNKYNGNSEKVTCECNAKLSMPLISDIEIDTDKLINKFFDFKHLFNYEVVKCYRLLITIEGIKNNLGSYIIIGLSFINLILLILFIILEYKKL